MAKTISLPTLRRISAGLDVTISPSMDGSQLVVSVHHSPDMVWLLGDLTNLGYRYGDDFQYYRDGLTIAWSGL